MRIEQIFVSGYGILHDLAIDLEPDITIIYGLNGTGKTTLHSFISTCLYGFHPRSSPERYEPVIGGSHGGHLRIRHGQSYWQITRSPDRKSQGTVRIEDLETGAIIPESSLNMLLGGISRQVFESVFAFDLAELQRLELMQDQELVALLYSVGIGTNIPLAASERYLAAAVDELYKPKGKKPVINTKLAQLQATAAQLRSLQSLPAQYQELLSLEAEIEKRIASTKGELARIRQELQHIKVLLDAWPVWQELLIHEQSLDALPTHDLPVSGLERITELHQELESLNNEIMRLKEKLPPSMLNHPTDNMIAKIDEISAALVHYEKEFAQQNAEILALKEHVQVLRIDHQQLCNQLEVIKQKKQKMTPPQLQNVPLPVQLQSLTRIKELRSLLNTTKSRNRWLADIWRWGWLILGLVFYFTDETAGLWITLILGTFAVLSLIKESWSDKRLHRQLRAELDQLVDQFGIQSHSDDLLVWEQRLHEQEELAQEQSKLQREVDQKSLALQQFTAQLEAKENSLQHLVSEWKKLLEDYGLPTVLTVEEVKSVIDVLAILPGLQRRSQQCNESLTQIYQRCGTTDIDRITQLYHQHELRLQTEQKVKAKAIVLETTLGEPLDTIRVRLQGLNQENIRVKEQQLLLRQKQLETELEADMNTLGKIRGQKETLEHNQETEQCQFQLALLKTEMEGLVADLLSKRILQHVIFQIREQYEKEKQPIVLKQASHYFAEITEGQYKRIFVPLATRDIRVEDKDGRILNVTQLSQGTVEQLYLALRFALVANICITGQKLPIILDDVLVNFDDHRLLQTIKLLQQISKEHQVIFLTCHHTTAQLFPHHQIRVLTA